MTAQSEEQTPAPHIARREERSPTNWIATLRLRDGTEIPCTVKDVSKSGARIGIAGSQVLPPVFMLRIIGRDFLCLVRLVWRRGDYAGVRIERVGKIAGGAKADAGAQARERSNTDAGGIGTLSRKRDISAF